MSDQITEDRRWAIGLGLALLGVAAVLGPRTVAIAGAAEKSAESIRLVIDYGDGVELHFKALGWRKGMTVLDALAAAAKHRRGVAFKQRGSGGSALVTQIGDLKNGGGGAQAKNWMYYVNGQEAEIGAGAQSLKPNDVVLWRFQVYDYNP